MLKIMRIRPERWGEGVIKPKLVEKKPEIKRPEKKKK